jgi:hypothetical protein
MSKQWSYFDIECKACGNKGEASMWSDDWNRWDGNLVGFEGALRVTGPRPGDLRCEKCKGTNITVTSKSQS